MRECWREKPSERPSFPFIRKQLERMMLSRSPYLELTDVSYTHVAYSETDSDEDTIQENTAL